MSDLSLLNPAAFNPSVAAGDSTKGYPTAEVLGMAEQGQAGSPLGFMPVVFPLNTKSVPTAVTAH